MDDPDPYRRLAVAVVEAAVADVRRGPPASPEPPVKPHYRWVVWYRRQTAYASARAFVADLPRTMWGQLLDDVLEPTAVRRVLLTPRRLPG